MHRLACLLVAVLLAAALPGCGLFKQTANNKETQEGNESMGVAGQVVASDKAYKEGTSAYMQEKYGEEFKLTESSVAIVDNVYAGRGEDVYPVAHPERKTRVEIQEDGNLPGWVYRVDYEVAGRGLFPGAGGADLWRL